MDLSGLKWPIIIVIVAGIAFLLSSPGVDFMVNRFTNAAPGVDADRDRRDEAGLTRIAGYLLYQWRYERSLETMQLAMQRYGSSGANYWYNKYRSAKCLEKLNRFQESYTVLQELIASNAHEIDSRVADENVLRLRATRLKEVHNLR